VGHLEQALRSQGVRVRVPCNKEGVANNPSRLQAETLALFPPEEL